MTRRLLLVVVGAVVLAGGAAAAIVLALGSSGKERWVIRELGTLPGFPSCRPTAVNETGQIVGSCSKGAVQRGFLWQNGKMIDLGPADFSPAAINEHGQVVGGGSRGAFLWQNGRTTWLGTLGGARERGAGDQRSRSDRRGRLHQIE